ncbi:MAG: family 43 glycosylhydrolase, partial [Clostridia bacterium]|nr:family 43 glycosylhydrolase [Clostridia bacterium]
EFEVESIANNIRIYNADNIKEHITLPTEMDGALIEWFSEDGCITSDGIVTRGMSDKKVKLTAKISKNNLSKVREFDVIVKAKSEEKVPAGYIYAYFRGNVNGEEEIQQIHLAISRDGLNWKDMNGNRPIITSDMGTKGIRDPYIIRSYENDKFYLMATDLDANGKVWSEVAVEGSRYLMFWESDDLINWSEQRMVRISEDYMGCTWAPEAIYDEENKQYVMYWASSDLNDNGRKKIYYCTTRDFRSFTKPELYIDHTDFQIIDTTMIKGDDGRYYRFTKREDEISVYLEVGNSPLGKFTKIDSNIENVKGVEGPAIFTLPDGKYCLMLDGYTRSNKGVGFFPLVSDDIAGGKFTRLTSGYSMPTGAKHGVMLAVTEEEYEAIVEKWGPEVPCEHGSAPDLEFFFDDDETGYKLFGNARIEDGKLILDGNTGTYAELEKGVFNRRDTFSVSMDVLSNMESGYFFTFGIGNDTNDYFYLRIRGNQVRLAQTISGNSYEERITYDAASGFNEQWHNYVIVGNPDGLRLYIDGVMAGSLETKKHSGILEMTLEFILENPPSRKTSTSTEALIM